MQHEKVWAPKCCKHNGKWRFQLRNVANNCKYGWNGSFQLQNAANRKKNGQKSRSKKTSQNGQTNNSQNSSGPIKILVGDFGFLKIGVFAQGQLNCWPQLERDMTLRWEPLQRTKSTERKKTWPKRTGMKSMQKAPAPATGYIMVYHWSAMWEVAPSVWEGWHFIFGNMMNTPMLLYNVLRYNRPGTEVVQFRVAWYYSDSYCCCTVNTVKYCNVPPSIADICSIWYWRLWWFQVMFALPCT